MTTYGHTRVMGADTAANTTVTAVGEWDDSTQVLTIVDLNISRNSGANPHPGDSRQIAAQEVLAEWLHELPIKRLAAMIMLLPAGNGIREMARYALRKKDPYGKAN